MGWTVPMTRIVHSGSLPWNSSLYTTDKNESAYQAEKLTALASRARHPAAWTHHPCSALAPRGDVAGVVNKVVTSRSCDLRSPQISIVATQIVIWFSLSARNEKEYPARTISKNTERQP